MRSRDVEVFLWWHWKDLSLKNRTHVFQQFHTCKCFDHMLPKPPSHSPQAPQHICVFPLCSFWLPSHCVQSVLPVGMLPDLVDATICGNHSCGEFMGAMWVSCSEDSVSWLPSPSSILFWKIPWAFKTQTASESDQYLWMSARVLTVFKSRVHYGMAGVVSVKNAFLSYSKLWANRKKKNPFATWLIKWFHAFLSYSV